LQFGSLFTEQLNQSTISAKNKTIFYKAENTFTFGSGKCKLVETESVIDHQPHIGRKKKGRGAAAN
jgi:hypothetical protein